MLRIFCFLLLTLSLGAQTDRWEIENPHTIRWNVAEESRLPHADNIEMAGRKVAAIVSYAVDTARQIRVSRDIIFPQLHPYLKSTDPWWQAYRAYFRHIFADADVHPIFYVGEQEVVPGPVAEIRLDGKLYLQHAPGKLGMQIERWFYPSTDERQFIELWKLTNTNDTSIILSDNYRFEAVQARGADGSFTMVAQAKGLVDKLTLAPGEAHELPVYFTAIKEGESQPAATAAQALTKRQEFLEQMRGNLKLETPDPALNTLFEFSKVRASENIFDSKLGVIHSPGGGRYYVGIWANDQAEYVSPFFPYLGYDLGNESADNNYRAFASETTPDYQKIRYSFEVETLRPPAALDRGDAAMIAYGAAQYALALGNVQRAEEHWPLIEWCLEYNHRNRNAAGVVRSESDEMEGRIETGNANLSTASLYYGALLHSADLADELKRKKLAKTYRKRARELAVAIENYFGANVEGLDTYKYFEAHRTLRHWIALPLVVGIDDRAEATITALFDRLWTDRGGVHVEKNNENPEVSNIFWDRGTLYALRGTFLAGATDRSLEKLQTFSRERLLRERVPYVVEAYPEGAMAHLSAESGLYCRVFTEGLFGIRPVGFRSFTCRPVLPSGWDNMALRRIRLFGRNFDLETERRGDRQLVRVVENGKVVFEKLSDLAEPLVVVL